MKSHVLRSASLICWIHPRPKWFCFAIGLFAGGALRAEDRLFLRDGMEIRGMADIQESRIVVKSGPRMMYFGARQLLRHETSDAEPSERIPLPQPPGRAGGTLPGLARPPRAEPFDLYGRRSLTFADPRKRDRETSLVQAITEIYPTHVLLRSMNHNWRSVLDLSQIPSDQLVPILKKQAAANQTNWIRMTNLLIQAGRFDEARAVLVEFREKFANAADRAVELQSKLDKSVADKAIDSMMRAVASGQFRRARQIESAMRKVAVPDDLQIKLNAIATELSGIEARVAETGKSLQTMPLEIASDHREQVAAAARQIQSELSPATLHRLEPFAAAKDNASAMERAALALSGWTLGPTLAQKDFEFALKAWMQRSILQRCLAASSDVAADGLVSELRKSQPRADLILQMIDHLPAPDQPGNLAEVQTVELEKTGVGKVVFRALLPPEYDRSRSYPMLVALHPGELAADRYLRFWQSQAAEHGYLVIAPEYRLDPTRPYGYGPTEHHAVLECISAARKRWGVDADRVFLAGHETGAMAAWDIGMAHPDQFAGLIPICGTPLFYCNHYWPNLRHVPLYAVEGEYNGDNAAVIQQQFLRYFTQGFDAIYIQYPGCGREMFPGEAPRIFDWMSRKRRNPSPGSFSCVSARVCDRRFYWLEADSFMPNAVVAPELFNKEKFSPAKLEGQVGDANVIDVKTTMLDRVAVYVPSKLVQLDAPDLMIRVRSKVIHRGPIEPDWELAVRELRRTGDRKNLVVRKFVAAP